MKRTTSVALSIIILALMWLPVAAAQPRSETILGTHIVQEGETLYCIGRAYGVDPWVIAAHNVVFDANLIHPGDPLQIPDAPASLPEGPVCERQFEPSSEEEPAPDCECVALHTVVTGDTLTQLAAKYELTVEEIAQCNSISDPNYIRIADVLCIPAPAP